MKIAFRCSFRFLGDTTIEKAKEERLKRRGYITL